MKILDTILQMIENNTKRKNLSKAGFNLAIIENDLQSAIKWYNRHKETIKTDFDIIILYNQ